MGVVEKSDGAEVAVEAEIEWGLVDNEIQYYRMATPRHAVKKKSLRGPFMNPLTRLALVKSHVQAR